MSIGILLLVVGVAATITANFKPALHQRTTTKIGCKTIAKTGPLQELIANA